MPRDLPLGNGTLLINFDSRYRLRDVYYPHVGMENQTNGHLSRFGVWVDGQFTWVGDAGWTVTLDYVEDSLVTQVRLTHADLGLTLECSDAVDFHENVLIRRCTVINARPEPREVRLFWHHDFHIYGTDVGDTVFYDPHTTALIHYKRERYLLINAGVISSDPAQPDMPPRVEQGLHGWATGKKEIPGSEGTWRDAEDGVLGGSPIAQGAVDSVVQINLQVPAATPPPADPAARPHPGAAGACLWLCLERDYPRVRDLDARVRAKSPLVLIERTAGYWRLWANEQDFDYEDLPAPLVTLFKRSLLVMRTQIDNDGAVIAANDSDVIPFGQDTYSYMWPRDGALATYALIMAGYRTTVRYFFDFCARVISGDGYLLHKYNPGGSVASSWHPWEVDGQIQLPIQEDETALVIWALWQWFHQARNVEDMKPWYRPLIIAGADFMVGFRDRQTGLPLPSYDLWEERHGVFAWTAGAVYGGLLAAANFAEAFGETGPAAHYRWAADLIKGAVEKHLYHGAEGRFVRAVYPHPDGSLEPDLTIDASLVGLYYFGMFPPDDPRLVATMTAVHDRLWVATDVGGVARYENDTYQRHGNAVTGNPWFVCTLWLAQWQIAKACTTDDLHEPLALLAWVAQRALPSGVLAEQVDPHTGAPLSVSPLTWSHATYVAAVTEYLDKKSELSMDPDTGALRYFRERRSLRDQHQHHITLRQPLAHRLSGGAGAESAGHDGTAQP